MDKRKISAPRRVAPITALSVIATTNTTAVALVAFVFWSDLKSESRYAAVRVAGWPKPFRDGISSRICATWMQTGKTACQRWIPDASIFLAH